MASITTYTMNTKEEAQRLDSEFSSHRDKFVIPTFQSLGISNTEFRPSDSSIYLCGNSLGLMPRSTKKAITDELDAWGERAVESHFNHPGKNASKTSWVDIDLPLVPLLAPIVGALNNEVAVMGSLTANLNALLMSFYKPKGTKTKILFEKRAFPSDYYAFLNMVMLHGFDESHLVQIEVPEGETFLETDLILQHIETYKEELALVCLPGIQYYTGQFFDIETITKAAHSHNIVVGWDLAHAVGNVPLSLHDWGVDFAAWCSYKYLNSGPGAIAGIFVHEKHTKENSTSNFTPRLAGWWGNNASDRFKMLEIFDPMQTALSYRQSNPSVIDCVALKASLEIFQEVGGVNELRSKSIQLTKFMERLLTSSRFYLQPGADKAQFGFKILTPLKAEERGCQLSLLFQPHHDDPAHDVMEQVFSYLHKNAIICDERRPDVIRLAPVPLYNSFHDVYIAIKRLEEALNHIEK
ncbi:putative kynureninase [Clavispora lusitaniae]|uniref:Kynureninase n=1 Tax=Clavispora lusitaniae TaxID=36911 RepID=A0ACD0WMG2_CLALS|nr:putative kynureninase [Clavispora lusitaniae]QFZ34325.1 putative kynureninase [Clavispora lusitaniae]QFZ40009.1 putative kynureninase [Clavispora lusitaniae]QFZ45691.1 putative kynureninase [Clavispora lusitaniae]QFZ51355.1 putative kynureninase [Clavispora lusitaniae]